MRRTTLLLACLGLLIAADSHAHGGGLNSEGCHNNRKTGDYHCHRGGGSAPARQDLVPRFQDSAPRNLRNAGPGSGPGGAFRNCDEARAAGAAPVHRGDPGYGPHLDRDNDGIGCEPYRGY